MHRIHREHLEKSFARGGIWFFETGDSSEHGTDRIASF